MTKVQFCTVQEDWPRVKHEHRWWVLQTVLLLTRNPWWTLTDFTYKPDTLSLAPNSCLPVLVFFFFSSLLFLVLASCVPLCRILLSFVVRSHWLGRIIYPAELFIPAGKRMLLSDHCLCDDNECCTVQFKLIASVWMKLALSRNLEPNSPNKQQR